MKEKEELEFFDKKDLRKAGRKAKRLDDKKSHHYFAKILITLIVLLIAGCCIYYFVIDTPKKFYTKVVDTISKGSNINKVKTNSNLSYTLNTNITSDDPDTKKLLSAFNQLDITGTIKYNDNLLIGSNTIKYKKEDLLDITYMVDSNEENAYFKLDKALDKTIKVSIAKTKEETTYDFNKDDYNNLVNSFIRNLKLTLEDANYERKITLLDKNIVFKETLLLDETFEKELLTKLLHDDDFIKKLAKIENKTEEEISDYLNQTMEDTDTNVSTLSIYRDIINNKILKLELKDEDTNITITNENNKYLYEITEENELKYKGYVEIIKNGKENKLTFSFDGIEEKISFDINLSYKENNIDPEILDKEKAIDYNDLTEEDMTKVTDYITNNKTFNTLLDDLELKDQLYGTETNM